MTTKRYGVEQDLIVVGGGPAGMMAAGHAGECKAKVLLVEKTYRLGSKLLITGGGKCNITNTADLKGFISAFGKNGKFLYGSNRGENTIVVFKMDKEGLLSLAGHASCGGDWPRNFVIDPSGRFLLSGNQKSGNITVFRINRRTGSPGLPIFGIKIKSPAYLEFVE